MSYKGSIPVLMASVALALSGCGGQTAFVSTWTAPDAQQLQVKGAKVAAVVMMKNESSRRQAEDVLASEITARGAVGVPMYSIMPDADPDKEAEAREALKAAGVKGVVVMRPVGVDKEVNSTPVMVTGYGYGGYWGGYYGYGWGAPYAVSGGQVYTDTNYLIETLIYSLDQNKLVWAGQSKTTNPENVEQLIVELSDAVAAELKKEGLTK